MNDTTRNPYLKNRYMPIEEYTLHAFLFNDTAIERTGDYDDIKAAICKILASLGFEFGFLGFKFMLILTARYLIKSDYDEEKEIQTLAELYGTDPRIVRDSIKACVNYNKNFLKAASRSLGRAIRLNKAIEITDVTEIVGALFKIRYNYAIDNEQTDDGRRAVNFVRMTLKNG